MKVCVSIDMDNHQEYARLVGAETAESGQSFYIDAVPRFLDILDAAGARATFFAIGRDLRVPAHRRILREVASRGHEIGNHSYSHPYDFRALSREVRSEEIRTAEEAIADAVGERPVGFRTPSVEIDGETLRILIERGYLYDSSIIPSPLMLAFMLYGRLFIRESRYQLGPLGAITAPSNPYVPDLARAYRRQAPAERERGATIVELPFSLIPYVRFPFYSTLLRMFGGRAFDLCTRFYDRRRPMLHFLFHLIDVVDHAGTDLGEKVDAAPGLGVPVERRRRFVAHVVERLAEMAEAVPLREVAAEMRACEGAT